jgi:tyrosyl-tRNA synthetase
VALIGGGTTMIGDPWQDRHAQKCSPRRTSTTTPSASSPDGEVHRLRRGQGHHGEHGDWLLDLNYVDFLREVGAYFSVNNIAPRRVLQAAHEKGLSFFEFNYMIMQSYDFYHLYTEYGCNMQSAATTSGATCWAAPS